MNIQPLGTVKGNDPHVYCGDKCGRGCSRDEYNQALGEAESAASIMPGWTGHVWENLGWHWCLIREAGDVRWNLALNRRGMWECYSYGASQQVWTVGFNTPQEAVAAAVNALVQQIGRANRDIRALTGKQL